MEQHCVSMFSFVLTCYLTTHVLIKSLGMDGYFFYLSVLTLLQLYHLAQRGSPLFVHVSQVISPTRLTRLWTTWRNDAFYHCMLGFTKAFGHHRRRGWNSLIAFACSFCGNSSHTVVFFCLHAEPLNERKLNFPSFKCFSVAVSMKCFIQGHQSISDWPF